RDESLYIRAAITNTSADSDVWDATSISTFAVESAQTATQIFRSFRRCEESLGRINVHRGLACQCQTKLWRHEAMYGVIWCGLSVRIVQINRGFRFGLCKPSIECPTDSGVRNSTWLCEVRIDKARRRGDKLQARPHELP